MIASNAITEDIFRFVKVLGTSKVVVLGDSQGSYPNNTIYITSFYG